MYELIQLTEHDYYIDCPAKIGLVLDGSDVYAIDSGNDKDAGKKVLRHIEANGWHLKAILNTHSHADHIGGNKFLQDRTGCKIYARGLETVYTNHPELESMTLFGGMPLKELKNKFLMAQTSHAEELTADVLPAGMEILDLPGHSFDMVGFRTADGTVYLGDCVSSQETLEKYGIGYLWDPAAYCRTLESVKAMQSAHFVPAHAPVTDDIIPLAQRNMDAVQQTAQCILEILATPKTFDDTLKAVFDAYKLTMNAQQYALIGSTLRSYLSWLCADGRAAFLCENNALLWKAL